MTYDIKLQYQKLWAHDGSPLNWTDANTIFITAVVTKDGDELQSAVKLQLYVDPASVYPADSDGILLDKQGNSFYTLKTDDEGICNFKFAALVKTISEISLMVEDDQDSLTIPVTIAFTSYTGLSSQYMGPGLPYSDGVIKLTEYMNTIHVSIPAAQTQVPPDANVALLVNDVNCMTLPYETAIVSGFDVPIGWLIPYAMNNFNYIISYGVGKAAASMLSRANVEGTFVLRPQVTDRRNLKNSPRFEYPNMSIQTADYDITAYLTVPEDNDDKLKTGDEIQFLLYLNAYWQGTNKSNDSLIHASEVIHFDDTGEEQTLKGVFKSKDLHGFGMSNDYREGTYYLDYVLYRKKEDLNYNPEKYPSGPVNTVGPLPNI